MKLSFKRALTDKSQVSIGLEPLLNGAVLPSVTKGKRVSPGEPHKKTVYRFGPFQLDTSKATLTRNSSQLKLQDLPYRLLAILVEKPGEIVSREEVRQRLWPQNTFVEFDNSLGVAIRKIRDALGDNADAPCYVETVPRRGYRFLAPVTTVTESQDPARPVTPEPLRPPISSLSSEKHSAISAQRLRYIAIAAFIVLGIGGTVYRFRRPRTRIENTTAAETNLPLVHVRRSVAVIGFRNLPGHAEDAWLSAAFSEMLSTELAGDGTLRMIPGEDIARARRDLPVNDEDSLSKNTLDRLRKDPGADVVVLGSYTLLPGKEARQIRLDVRLQDTARGEIISEQAFVGNERDLFDLVSQAGASLRQHLGTAPASEEIVAQVRDALPKSPLAVKLYTAGLERLWAFDFMKARELLIQAVAVEPDFPLAHSALSDTWNHLGYGLKARDEAEQARRLSEHLGIEGHLQIEGQYYSALQDRDKTIGVYRQLFSRYPDSLDYGLRLADQQRWVSPDDALRTLASLRRLPPPASDDPRLDILEARIWVGRDSAKAQAAGRRAVAKGTAQGSALLVARAYGVLCGMLDGGSTSQAIQDCQNARRSYAEVGDRNNEARTESDFGGLYFGMGDLDKAEKMFREAITVFREVGDVEGLSAASGNLGDVFLAKGNLDDAERALSGALSGAGEMGDKDGIALTLNDLGDIARLRGDLTDAQKRYEQAKSPAQEIDDKRALAYILSGVGDVLFDRGDLTGAQQSYEDSLNLRKQLGDQQTVAESELSLARLAVEEGRASDAEMVIRKCKDQFHQDQQADDELSASTALIEGLLAQSKYQDAKAEVNQSASLAAKSVNLLLRLQFDLASARTESALEGNESTRTVLERTLQDAKTHKLFGLQLQTRLALAELQARAGQFKSAQSELHALEQVAHDKGFEHIAVKARRSSLQK